MRPDMVLILKSQTNVYCCLSAEAGAVTSTWCVWVVETTSQEAYSRRSIRHLLQELVSLLCQRTGQIESRSPAIHESVLGFEK